MATKSKENGQTVKEKRGTSPYPRHTDPPAAQRRRSPTPAAAKPGAAASTSGEKQVPNYLKPTISSKLDPSKQPSAKKQPFTDFTTPKATPLTRRRSFDKPPSPSRIPKPNSTSPNSTEKGLRSSSFSSKTTPVPKAQLEKLSKASKEPRASNVRKTIVTNSKKQIGASSATRASTSKGARVSSPHTVADSLKPELQHKDEELSPTEVVEEINDQKLPAAEIMQLEEDKEHVHVDLQNEAEIDESEELKHCVDSCTVTEDQSASQSVETEESQGETPTEENINNHQELADNQESSKEEILDQSRHQQQDSTFTGELEVDGEKKEAGEEMATADPKENSSELKEEVEQSKEVPKPEEARVERVAKVAKPEEAENVVKKNQGGSREKKDTAAYNDVIEETASKLREQRKNKVKALVGAFETVISLESDTTAE